MSTSTTSSDSSTVSYTHLDVYKRQTIYKHLCEFVPKVYRRDDIPLKELNLTSINNFEYFLRTENDGL